jgi:hypothetical protein
MHKQACFVLFVVCFVYQNKPQTIDALEANIIEEIQAVTADVLARNFQNMTRRVQSYLGANGGQLHHML